MMVRMLRPFGKQCHSPLVRDRMCDMVIPSLPWAEKVGQSFAMVWSSDSLPLSKRCRSRMLRGSWLRLWATKGVSCWMGRGSKGLNTPHAMSAKMGACWPLLDRTTLTCAPASRLFLANSASNLYKPSSKGPRKPDAGAQGVTSWCGSSAGPATPSSSAPRARAAMILRNGRQTCKPVQRPFRQSTVRKKKSTSPLKASTGSRLFKPRS
mmetsp:Transcript_70588/g.133148  ORF Transcript_70588/g.133148 Transcript_70588/m.133148 type:complete len:209 (+) Transcript_70588:253-879(+)